MRWWLALALFACFALASTARAQDEPAPGSSHAAGSEQSEAAEQAGAPERRPVPDEGASAPPNEIRLPGEPPSIPPRPVPDYDGRDDPGPTAEEILLWVPRVLFFPVHLVFEYGLRQPVGWFLTTAEREGWTALVVDFFTWNERTAGLVPTAFYDFGFQPSIGLYLWWNDLGFPGNQLRAQIAFGGVDWLRGTLSDRIRTSRESELAFTADAWRRPDYVFQGFGWATLDSEKSRYIRTYVEGRAELRIRPWRGSEFRVSTGIQWNDFDPNGYAFASDDISLAEAVLQGRYDLPPGFDGYTAYFQRLAFTLDTREERPAPGHGVRLEGFVLQGFDLEEVVGRRWLRYGGALGGFLDVGSNRVFALFGQVELADSLGEEPVPFTELAELGGGPLVMSGFLRGSLMGRSAAALTLEYRYPIWVFLDGSVHVSVGNVFDEHFEDFDVERLRVSFGIGFRSIGDRDQSFNVLLAFGSEAFAVGGNIDSVRLVIGSQQGF